MQGSKVTVIGFAYHLHAIYIYHPCSFCLCLMLWAMRQQKAGLDDSVMPTAPAPQTQTKARGVHCLLQAAPLG